MGGSCNTTEHPRWNINNTHFGTDDYGFSGLPGGYRYYYGGFDSIGDNGDWWSSSEESLYGSWFRYLYYGYGYVGVNGHGKNHGFSVRCLRD